MVWQVGIYNEGTKGGILSADTNCTAGPCHLQVRVRRAPNYMTSSRLVWGWTPSPEPLFRPLPIAGVSFLRGVFEEYSPNPPIAPGPWFLPLEIRGSPACQEALTTQRLWPRSPGAWDPSLSCPPHTSQLGQAFTPAAPNSSPESSFLISGALLQPLGWVTGAACPTPRGGLGAISRNPPDPSQGLWEKSQVSL